MCKTRQRTRPMFSYNGLTIRPKGVGRALRFRSDNFSIVCSVPPENIEVTLVSVFNDTLPVQFYIED
jgi:hypothetical protein